MCVWVVLSEPEAARFGKDGIDWLPHLGSEEVVHEPFVSCRSAAHTRPPTHQPAPSGDWVIACIGPAGWVGCPRAG